MNVGVGTYGADQIAVHDWGQGTTLTIGNYCSLAPNLRVLLGGNHRSNRVTTFPFQILYNFGTENDTDGYSNGDVVIKNDVWIGYGVTIMSGVTIGNGAIVAANSHVFKDVAPYSIVGGNPAKHITFRFTPTQISQLEEIAWWDWPVHKIQEYANLLLRTDIDEFINAAKLA
jgi:chloramphenicol O-acetyltransferase type B